MAIVMMLYLHFDIFIVYVFTYDVHLHAVNAEFAHLLMTCITVAQTENNLSQ